jgi:hypothetical protein
MVAMALQLVAQLAIVVDLTVLNDNDAAVFVGNRLITGNEIHYREAPRGKPDCPVSERSVAVWSSMRKPLAHRLERVPLNLDIVERHNSADAAHQPLPLCWPFDKLTSADVFRASDV